MTHKTGDCFPDRSRTGPLDQARVVVFGPLCGIQIAGFYFLRRQELDVRGLYIERPGTTYWYTGGVNVVGFVSLVAGVCTYFALLDPITFDSAGLFKYTTASIPTTVVSLVLYATLARLIERRRETRLRRSARLTCR